MLVQFANHIGVFILYLLIEAMRPTRDLIPRSMRVDKALDFIQTAIPYSDLFNAFLNLLPRKYRKDIVLGAQMKENSFNKLTDAFRGIYPRFYKAIEGGYPQHLQDAYLEIRDDKCEHKWKQTFVHKIGMYYKCTRCRSMERSLTGLQSDG